MAHRFLTLVLSALAICTPLTASAQVKPRIVIAFDTSGSMALDLSGTPTFGDGVTTGCSGAGTNASPYCGGNCTAGIDTNCDNQTNDSRIYVAKEAVRNMILGYGDVDWALARFSQNQGANLACLRVNDYECNTFGPYVTSYGNPQCNTGSAIPAGSCPFDWGSLIPAACRPGSGGRPSLRTWAAGGGGSPTVCTNYDGVCAVSGSGGDILVGFPNMGAFSGMDNTYGMLSWINGTETSFVNSRTSGNFCNSSTTGDCELRPSGPTPLGGLLSAVQSYIVPIRTSDAASSCRPYSVILLTDGAETCGGNPVTVATTLRTNGILTYVVGVAITAADRTQLNSIATAGGTDAGATGGDTAYFANDPATLAAGLAEIVRRSIRVETCNGMDDDCDTRIDEGVLNACGSCGAVPTETCNTADDDCDTRIDEGVSNLCGTCGPAPAEVCNVLDDDCDGIIDEGVCGGCVPVAEICDNSDNDCDGRIDESLTRSCGTDVGECVAGTQTCAAGSWGTCVGSVGPRMETCNNRDDDCDGAIDGFSRACGSDVGACQAGTQVCTAGSFGSCIGAIGPTVETCNNVDDDCNGTVDDGIPAMGACGSSLGACRPGTLQCNGMGTLVCTGGVSPSPESCNGTDDDCDGATDESVPTMGACGSSTGECSPGTRRCVGGSFMCVGGTGPTAELCDGRDNDCDGTADEGNPGGGVACGSDTGICTLGSSRCTGGMLVCMGGTGPGTETCDNRDEDCDGLVDEGNPGGGARCGATDVGECEFGALRCTMGSLTCVGATGPAMERCDGLDNDCDGMVDEGNPEGGVPCGDDTGECTLGATLCMGGTLVCDGGTGPTPEICDGLDNDCDGVEDEGLGVGAPCGSDVGECSPGVNVCRMGALVCDGEIGPRPEECNLLDDDCDGVVDNDLALGGPCGSDEGICMAGREQCIGGVLVCMGSVEPAPEGCNCSDDDCDGTVDEGDSLCPSGTACRGCGCADACTMSEFGFTCPTGTTPEMDGADCWCVAPRCDETECAMRTIEVDGDVVCGPDLADVASCVCKPLINDCTFSCDGVTCAPGLRCNPRDPLGRCVEDTCRGLGCPSGQVCNRVTGDCETDRCADVSCGAGEACRDGACEASCATVDCPAGQRCAAGACVDDACADVHCLSTEVCDPATGSCVDAMCDGVLCPSGTLCDPVTGTCEEDPCARLHCPAGEMCVAGECAPEGVTPDGGVDAGVDGGVDGGPTDEHHRVLASGGGGCVCAVPGAAERQSGLPALWLTLGLFGLVVARRRQRGARGGLGRRGSARVAALALVVAAALLFGAGCDVDPYCLDCVDDAGGGVDSGIVDAGTPDGGGRDGGMVDAGPEDAGPDGCVVGAPERCNEFDDDCDGMVDEGVDTTTDVNNCGGCGIRCAPANAFPSCTDGVCGLERCRTGFYDIDMDETDGCEYRCSTLDPAPDDSVCDRRDNDCDMRIDEDVDFMADPSNCGACGTVCRFAHASGTCSSGTCELGACDPDFWDVDGAAGNGCEYACTQTMTSETGAAACNARDDDCDGVVDDGDPGGGGTCGTDTGACSRGVEHCMGGAIVCTGAVSPTTETCNGMDDDCDGMIDDGNPDGGAVCGTSVGACESGRQQCMGGSLVCVGAIGPVTEACNGLDDDCDTRIDEGDPGGGAACGPGTGACSPGTLHCRGGVLACEGAVGPTAETCNSMDDDCDTRIDEGNPGGGAACGTDIGECSPGTRTCMAGSLVCVGAVGPTTETCDGLNNDCDANVDEGNPGGGAACGIGTGECTPGVRTCAGGTLQCLGGTGPGLETCNGLDDDCDGTVDNGFTLSNDPNNCGMCGRVCSFPNAIAGCSAGTCTLVACLTGFYNRNGSTADGCEYACDFAGSEICNGRDDNCDGTIDNGLTPPSTFCNPNGVCAGTTPTCSGAGGWVCNYPAATYQSVETRCDGRDNDCDGATDEPFPTVGTSCANGTGSCRRTGVIACNMAGTGTVCTAPPAGTPAANESCNNVDDDCDGNTDEAIPLSAIPTVSMPRAGGGTFRMMVYEASHPDATSTNAGTVATKACSNANVLPWTDVTWTQARNACCALNAGGACLGGGAGWRLCDAADWEDACQGPGGSCTWSYAASCSSSSRLTCNGEEYDSSPAAGDQDALFPTASSTFAMCYVDWSAAGVIYDLSGNVKEWTNTQIATNVHQIRGGAYNNVEPGRTCTYDFAAGDNNFSFPNTGFRCCYY